MVLRMRHVAAVLVILVALFAIAGGGPQAALASSVNRAVPVRCFTPGAGVTAGSAAFMTCYAADGTSFSGNQRVPTGYYLYVTDVIVTPRSGSTTTGVTEISVYDAYGTTSRQSQFYLRSTNTSSYAHTFSAPYMVLVEGHRLEILAEALNAHTVDVRATGWLVTSMTYLPMLTR